MINFKEIFHEPNAMMGYTQEEFNHLLVAPILKFAINKAMWCHVGDMKNLQL